MGRWQPGAQGRLMLAALELYTEQGFENTTALQVAERAGVTERTFYRYFADKREVLFTASHQLEDEILAAIAAAPADLPLLDVVGSAMQVGTVPLEENRPYSRQRAAVIAANKSLQERELLKMATIGTAVATALRARGASPMAANVAAESGISIFRLGFDNWVAPGNSQTLAECIRDAVDELRAIATS